MSRDVALLLAWISTAAIWLVVHAALLMRTARAPGLGLVGRVLAWLPPLSPFVAWKVGARAVAIAWVASGALYLALRSVE